MSKLIDGYRQVFSVLRPTDEDAAHNFTKVVVKCIADFWRFSSHRLEVTVEAMLQRGVLTRKAVIEQLLRARGPQSCDTMAVWNVLNTVAQKSLELTQSARLELAMAKRSGDAEKLDACRSELDATIHESAELFSLMFSGLVRNYQDLEDTDTMLRHVMLQRILMIGRKYHAFIKP